MTLPDSSTQPPDTNQEKPLPKWLYCTTQQISDGDFIFWLLHTGEPRFLAAVRPLPDGAVHFVIAEDMDRAGDTPMFHTAMDEAADAVRDFLGIRLRGGLSYAHGATFRVPPQLVVTNCAENFFGIFFTAFPFVLVSIDPNDTAFRPLELICKHPLTTDKMEYYIVAAANMFQAMRREIQNEEENNG